jgi:hypothetical protein
MRRPPLAVLFLLVPGVLSCSANGSATKSDNRVHTIEGSAVPGGAAAPDRVLAERVCPGGYQVLDATRHKEGNTDGSSAEISTTWVIRCL